MASIKKKKEMDIRGIFGALRRRHICDSNISTGLRVEKKKKRGGKKRKPPLSKGEERGEFRLGVTLERDHKSGVKK